MTDAGDLDELRSLTSQLEQIRQADILVYGGEITRPDGGQANLSRRDTSRRPACLLVLSTLGGSPDAAYRLARTLLRQYSRLTLLVDDYCKGAGMLLALAAHELVMSDFGELGPLDLTSQHAIRPGRGESGMSLVQSLNALRVEAESSFEQIATRLRSRRGAAMTARAANEHASSMAIGLLTPVFAQIDPLQIAEVDRAVRTARLYAERLGLANLKREGLERLLTGYPSHDFVIDRDEADDLLRTVRAPTDLEANFLTHVEPVMSSRRTQGRLLRVEEALAAVEGGAPREQPAPDAQKKESTEASGAESAEASRG
jgi:hypothetical protein